jgi:flagellar hook-length control protein FliK
MSANPVSPKLDAQPDNAAGGAIFRGLLDGSLAQGAAKTAGNAKLAQAPATVDGALELHVKGLLDKGVPADTVVKQLADALATQVAALLGITPQAAQAQLAQAFTQAFGSGGSGPPGETSAQRAAALVQTLRRIAEAATRVTNGDPGTPIRLIAGQRSDADTAKASPTPTTSPTDRLLRGALDALAGSAAPVTTALASTSSGAPGDGRTVALGGATALAAGGDTLLGRTLARAVLADQQRSAAADAASTGSATPVSTAASAAPTAPNAAVEAFLNAFAGALAQADAAGSGGSGSAGDGRHDSSSDGDPLGATAPAAAPDQPAAPFALAFAQQATPLDPTLPAPATAAAPAPAVDNGAVVDQLVRGMQIQTANGTSEVRLRLDPEQLGDVSIKLVVSGGTVDASITAGSAAARDALAGGQAQLARTLADAGLKLQSFTVGLAGGGFGQRQDSSHHAWANPAPRRIGGLGPLEPDEPVDDLGLLAVPSFGPPLVSGLRGYDYLV